MNDTPETRPHVSKAERDSPVNDSLDRRLLEVDRLVTPHGASAALRARIAAVPFAHRQTSAAATGAASGMRAWAVSGALRLAGIGRGDFWTPRAFAPAAAMLAVVALLGFAAGYQGLGAPLTNAVGGEAEILSFEDETLLPLSEDWS
jgi:hypothetical protein